MEKLYQFSCSVMSNSWQPYGLQHARLPCPSPTPRAYSSSYPLLQWHHPNISPSIVPFSSHLQTLLASGSFPMSQFSGHQLSWHQVSCLTQESELPGPGRWLRCIAHLGQCTHWEPGRLSFSDLGRAQDACPTHWDWARTVSECLLWRYRSAWPAAGAEEWGPAWDLLKQVLFFPDGSEGKVSTYSAGYPGLIPRSGRSSGEGNGNPLQYSCLENPLDGGAW